MAKLVNWHIFEKKIREKGFSLFTPLDVRRLFGISEVAVTFLLHRYTKKGLIIRPKKGLYMLADDSVSNFYIANKLYEPSYISFDTALSHHHLIPETIYSITSATTKTTRQFLVNKIEYTYQKIKKDIFTGYRAVKYRGETILLAEPEKAIADYLYFVDLKKRSFSYERLNLKKTKKNKLVAYVKLYRHPKMNKLIEAIYAHFRES